MLTPVDTLPPHGGRHAQAFAAADVREFLRKDLDLAEVSVKGKKPDAIKKSCMSYIRKMRIKDVEAVQRGGKCFLVRIRSRVKG